jgi:hypothetical protein
MESRTLSALISDAAAGKLLLPNFQREFSYDRSRQRDLISSVLTGIPLGYFLVLNDSQGIFVSRKIGRMSAASTAPMQPASSLLLLDGQQRLTTLWNAFTDAFADCPDASSKNERYGTIHNYLKSRWYLRLSDGEGEADVWGLKYLAAPENGSLGRLLQPDEVKSSIVHYGIKSDEQNWPNPMDFPAITGPSAKKEFYDFIHSTWCMPLHVIFDSEQSGRYLRHMAKRRSREMQRVIEDLRMNNIPWQSIGASERELLSKVIGVDDQAMWNQFDVDVMPDLLRTREDGWVDSMKDFFRFVNETKIGVVGLDESFLPKAHKVFDVINKSGLKLSVFDLFCASKPELDVRRMIGELLNEEWMFQFGLVDSRSGLPNERFLDQLLNMLKFVDEESKQIPNFSVSVLKDNARLFSMSSSQLGALLGRSVRSLIRSYQLLYDEMGVRSLKVIPYHLQIVPMAFSFYLNPSSNGKTEKYLYWLTLFSGQYRELQNSRCYKDLMLVYSFHKTARVSDDYKVDGTFFRTMLNVPGYNDHDGLVPAPNVQAFEFRKSMQLGLTSFVLSANPTDFPPNTGSTLNTRELLEEHHILPLLSSSLNSGNSQTVSTSTSAIRRQPSHYLNSPLNLALISKDANRRIGGLNYSSYAGSFDSLNRNQYGLPQGLPTDNEPDQRAWLRERHELLRNKVMDSLRALPSIEFIG